jgi:very-short-patch-repair endonuclease
MNDPRFKEWRREQRNEPTHAEKILWYSLRGSQLDGRKFRRQHGIGSFIVDFYCPEERLVIEVDGDIHDEPEIAAYDESREQWLTRRASWSYASATRRSWRDPNMFWQRFALHGLAVNVNQSDGRLIAHAVLEHPAEKVQARVVTTNVTVD